MIGGGVLGRVAEDRDDEHADERVVEPERSRGRLDRADQDLAHPGDHDGRGREHPERPSGAPRGRALRVRSASSAREERACVTSENTGSSA